MGLFKTYTRGSFVQLGQTLAKIHDNRVANPVPMNSEELTVIFILVLAILIDVRFWVFLGCHISLDPSDGRSAHPVDVEKWTPRTKGSCLSNGQFQNDTLMYWLVVSTLRTILVSWDYCSEYMEK